MTFRLACPLQCLRLRPWIATSPFGLLAMKAATTNARAVAWNPEFCPKALNSLEASLGNGPSLGIKP